MRETVQASLPALLCAHRRDWQCTSRQLSCDLKYSFQLPGNTTEFFDKYMVDLLNFPGEIELRSSKMELTNELKAKLTSAKGRIVFGAFDSKGWKK